MMAGEAPKKSIIFLSTLALLSLLVSYAVVIGGLWGKPAGDRPHFLILGDPYPETDFLCFWSASHLALSGKAVGAYSGQLMDIQERTFGTKVHRPWLYPPTFLLFVLPLVLLPFYSSLIVWILATLSGNLMITRLIAPHYLTPVLALAYPASFQNFVRGQNGFLLTIFLGGGLAALDRWPLVGGFLLGLLSIKPHFAILIPLALLVGRYWRALGAALFSGALLALISLVAFGPDTWSAFGKALSSSQNIMRQDPFLLGLFIPSFFSAMRLLGINYLGALFLHLAVAAAASGVVLWVWYRRAPLIIRASLLVIGMLLLSPYILVYDLTLLGIPLAMLAWEGVNHGWRPGELWLLLICWFMPYFLFPLARFACLQIGPFFLAALFIVVMGRFFGQDKIISPGLTGRIASR